MMYDRIGEILSTRPVAPCAGTVLGRSRQGRAVRGFRFGTGARRISLLAGCHADEPVGPLMLRHFLAYLSQLAPDDIMLTDYQWWIAPHINPDGEARNRRWYHDRVEVFDLLAYLSYQIRELPGDDIEFGFPRNSEDTQARPENRAVYEWWRTAAGHFALHVSLHGMGFAAGPWFLIEPAWRDRCDSLKQRCMSRVDELGYSLHDVEREGEKGFFRIQRGFCTRPDSNSMRAYFMKQGDRVTAELFRPSSMETIRALGGDPLTLVSEMPLFLTPGVGERIGPPDTAAAEWKTRIDRWRSMLTKDGTDDDLRREADEAGLRPMPIRDQMELQLTFVFAGIDLVTAGGVY
jgi:hypothetical protein